MSDTQLSIAHALSEAAKMMHSPPSLDETLDAITRAALRTVPGFTHVGISITHRDGTIETKSATDQLVWELDEVQYRLRKDPATTPSGAPGSPSCRTLGTTSGGRATCPRP